MTSPMVDTVRTIPLILEKNTCEPMEAENVDSGFPFDREDRDEDFRTQLDDIAKRHPEFAEHFEGFPFRSETLGRRRPPRPAEQDFRRFTDRPFGSSRFERFGGFPFNSDPFDEGFQYEQTPQQSEQPPSQPTPQPEEEKPKPERGRKQNIQPSNTVDLGQKQEPVNDRNQRSMSAPPPDNRQRYVSSIHIPINRDGGMGDMGKAQSQPQQQQPQQDKPVERVIPIHVEGRDEPVMPKHTGPSFSQPQPERIFGHPTSHYTPYMGREPTRQYTPGPEWHHSGFQPQQQKYQQSPPQQAPPQQQQQQKYQQPSPQQTPPQQQQQKFQQQTPPPQEQKQVPVQKQPEPQQVPPPQPSTSNTPIDLIQSIQKDVSELMGQVEKFSGAPRDKQYLYLDEMLTRNLIKLDNIDTQGQENIRLARKEAIKCIESCIGILEAKAAANVSQKQPEPQPVADPKPEESQEKMEVEETKKEVESEVEVKESEPKMEEKVEPEPPKAEEEEAPKAVEENMEVAPPPPVEEAPKATEETSQDTQPSEETKPDEEMKEAATEETSQEESTDDKKEKKGKKKNVKK